MFNRVKNISSRTIVISYTLGFLILVFLVTTGLYFIDKRNETLQDTISTQFSVNAIMKKFTEISTTRGIVMLSILSETDPFNRDELIQKYNGLTQSFLKYRELFD